MILFKTTNAEVYEFVPEDSTFESYSFKDITAPVEEVLTSHIVSFWEQSD